MKGDLTRLQPCLWVQAMERVEMEQICVTKQALKSDSCPTLAIGREQCERKCEMGCKYLCVQSLFVGLKKEMQWIQGGAVKKKEQPLRG